MIKLFYNPKGGGRKLILILHNHFSLPSTLFYVLPLDILMLYAYNISFKVFYYPIMQFS